MALAERYGVCFETVLRWARQGWLPCERLTAKTLRFDLDEVDKAIHERSKERHRRRGPRKVEADREGVGDA
jgi:predicted site-specific integrase-resolvase